MALPTFEKREDIPQGFEDEYEEQDGKWVPVDNTAALQKALAEERDARKAADALARKAAKDAADAANKQAASAAGMTEGELKKLYDSIEATVRAEFDPKLSELEQVQNENRTLKLDSRVKALFTTHGAMSTKIDDLWKLHGDEFDLTSDGKPMVKAEPGKDVARHVQGILKSRIDWTVGTKAAGGGKTFQNTTPPGTGSPNGLSFEDMVKNPSAAIAIANEG